MAHALTDDGTLNAYLRGSAAAHPGLPAVRDRRSQVSYADLDRTSGGIARLFVAGPPASGRRIGIWLNKTVESVAAIHAVLRAGAAYVPIDPAAPPLRAARILADCDATWLVTTAERAAALEASAPEVLDRLQLLLVGPGEADPTGSGRTAHSWEQTLAEYRDRPPVDVATGPDDVAYILYTSGSTGAPKGVVHTHRSARAFVDWAAEEFALTSRDALASHAPFHFDLSIFDLFAAARSGASVSLVPELWQGLGPALVRFVLEHGISVWYSVPTVLRRMAEVDDGLPLRTSALRVVAFAGEEYPLRHVRALAAAVPPGTGLYNLYGPTETNVCTYHRLADEDLADETVRAPSIGRTCPFATSLLLGPDGPVQPPAPGSRSTGELCIAGGSVMHRYWNDAAKTEASFVEVAGTRYYRTGDLVSQDDGGRFTFLGREDGMVKVKGYRIELGEIEAVLDSRPEVQEAVCIVVPAEDDTGRLVAFVTAAAGAADPDDRDLRRHCRDHLPGYMVPDRIETLPELRYTSTGKIDRRSLTTLAAP